MLPAQRDEEYGSKRVPDSLEYTGPWVAVLIENKEEKESPSLMMCKARHPVMHYLHTLSVSFYTSKDRSHSHVEELVLSREAVNFLQENASKKIEELFSKLHCDAYNEDTFYQKGNTLFDVLSLMSNSFRSDFGDPHKGMRFVLHFTNPGAASNHELRDDDGVEITSTHPLLAYFLDCSYVKTVCGPRRSHVYVEEPDFSKLKEIQSES